jgi:hypothetical protein
MVVSTVERAATSLAETPSDDEIGELSRVSGRMVRSLAADALGYRGHCTGDQTAREGRLPPGHCLVVAAGAVRAGSFPLHHDQGWRHPTCSSRSAIISLAAGLSTVSEIFDGDEQHRPAESRAHACQDLERTEKHHLMAIPGRCAKAHASPDSFSVFGASREARRLVRAFSRRRGSRGPGGLVRQR